MARKGGRRGDQAAIEWPAPPAALVLTKKDVVRRELSAAIRLFVNGGDPVAIFVLASAAAAIMEPIAQGTAKETWRASFLDRIKDEHRDLAEYVLDEPFNFMKHGARDAETELRRFNPDANETFLLLLCRDFASIFGDVFPEAVIYFVLEAYRQPGLIKDPDEPAFIERSRSVLGLAGAERLDLAGAARAIENFDQAVTLAATVGIDLIRHPPNRERMRRPRVHNAAAICLGVRPADRDFGDFDGQEGRLTFSGYPSLSHRRDLKLDVATNECATARIAGRRALPGSRH